MPWSEPPFGRLAKKKDTTYVVSFFLARLRGFEPPTYRLGGGRSIQLSYRRIFFFGASADPLTRWNARLL